MSEQLYDWHDSLCAGGTWVVEVGGEPVTEPCNCGFPDLFRLAFEAGRHATDCVARPEVGLDAYQILHDNGFSWDDVNAIAAILDHHGFDVEKRGSGDGG